ncbi:hypothetical protein LSH36_1351g00005 [Paralvinella palmiformis]|uniref:Uncharacterized protein n=1 Tax=Paralvinella palmiformis TaxID=53620 RepID=A0AAD9IUD3_9ANNE|nr:hypothetical protein LSH36_1351g00005 [Paralvinella palmiformis]
MTPVHSNLDAAPDYIIKLVRCTCKVDCSKRRKAVAVLVWSPQSHVVRARVYVQLEMKRKMILIYRC